VFEGLTAGPSRRHLLGWAALWTCGCGLRLGRAPSALPAVSHGRVEVGVPEPRLQEDLGRAVAREIALRARVGGGPALSAQVLEARVAPTAPGGALWEASLSVRFELAASPPRARVATARRVLQGHPGSWEATSTERADAFAALADQLAAEAVPALLAPAGGEVTP